MKDWLIKRLTPRKRQENRWTGLAEGLQQVWEEDFDPALARLENLRSYFLADDADLALKLREMGDYFAADMPRPQDRPIAVAWRRLELEYKDLELILYSVFRRHYSDLPVSWFPIFAPLTVPYGYTFIVADGPWPERKNIPPEGLFLTSRGRLGVDHGHLLSMGLSKKDFLEKGIPLLRRTKPLHIVYDGPLWYIRFDTPFEVSFSVSWDSENYYDFLFGPVGSRFDFTPDGARPLDTAILDLTRETVCEGNIIPFIPDYYAHWRLDIFLPEGFPEGLSPLDIVMSGYEGMPISPIGLTLSEISREYEIHVSSIDKNFKYEKHSFQSAISFAVNTEMLSEGECRNEVAYERGCLSLDQHPLLDEIPADFTPLDYPYGGYIHA